MVRVQEKRRNTYIYYDQLQFLIHSDESRETVTNLSPGRDILARQMEEVIANIEEGSDSFRAPTPTPTEPIHLNAPLVKEKFKKTTMTASGRVLSSISRRKMQIEWETRLF
ncbi:hypothetical protein QE152_g37514 [Popillia japonica]|uniref:Uncharacterized protein n=1 Tax=Popillia japonica TaxID=7064 RepID=A0AAW1IAC1_POPJA